MGTFSFAQKIASDSNCAVGGMMDRAAHLVPYLEDFRAEVLAAERKQIDRLRAAILEAAQGTNEAWTHDNLLRALEQPTTSGVSK